MTTDKEGTPCEADRHQADLPMCAECPNANAHERQTRVGEICSIATGLDADDQPHPQYPNLGANGKSVARHPFMDDVCMLQVPMQVAPRNEGIPPRVIP